MLCAGVEVKVHSEEEILASVKNGKTNDKCETSDTECDSEDNGDNSCKVVVPALNRVLGNITEVITLLEHQTDSEYMRFEVLTAVKLSVLFLWVVMPCGLVDIYQSITSILKMEVCCNIDLPSLSASILM
jgi:hypothetical protein